VRKSRSFERLFLLQGYGLLAIPPATTNFPYMSARIFLSRNLVVAGGLLLCGLLAIPVTGAAQERGTLFVDTIVAPSLKINLLGDSNRRAVSIYLPPDYAANPQRRYPVIYLLHGFSADDRVYTSGPYQGMNIRTSMDSLIALGAVNEMIVVTPNARNAFDGSFYVNSQVTGNWDDFIARDLVGWIDAHYRTVRNRSGRGIAGHSMGGFGALSIAMNHPEIFSAVYALSAYGLTPERALEAKYADSWKKTVAINDRSQIAAAGFSSDLELAVAAVYSPDLDRPPLFVDLPYRLRGDSLVPVESVKKRWAASLMNAVPAHASSLKQMAVAFDAGTADGFEDIPQNVSKLDSLLTRLGVAHTAELYDGDHLSRIRERLEAKVFPFFSQNLH
jgi:S-formylglutathione hydrolase FrmB